MDLKEFRAQAHNFVDWMADYFEKVESYPVKSPVKPGDIYQSLPSSPPVEGESIDSIFADFKEKIIPGITHWQNPNFYAYFPANGSYPSLLAEMLTATLGAQCMIWDTSPAAAELEEKCMNWLLEMMGLPTSWEGVIQPTASDATLCAILTARERATHFEVNKKGFAQGQVFRVYCSSQTHSSIEKAAKIAGIGQENVVKIAIDENFAMIPGELENAIQTDLEKGFTPLCVVAALGTTSSTAMDPINDMADICEKHKIWLHADAAYAGTALLLPEKREMFKGVERSDSFVFNPHKWMFTHFDCSVYFVKDKAALIQTFEILPEYLKTANTQTVNNYRDWGIPLGRRFRALKLWFVIRNFGIQGLQEKIRFHLALTQGLEAKIAAHPDFEILAPVNLNLICFRHHPGHISDESALNNLNHELLDSLNESGKLFLTHTKLNGHYTLRLCIGNSQVEQHHVDEVWDLVQEKAQSLA